MLCFESEIDFIFAISNANENVHYDTFHFSLEPKNKQITRRRTETNYSIVGLDVGYDKAQYKATAVWLERLTTWQMKGARPGGMALDVDDSSS